MKKRYDVNLKRREHASLVASKYIIAGVTGIEGAVFLLDSLMRQARISQTTASMINGFKHHWSVVCCVAGRYKNGKVWVSAEHFSSNLPAFAQDISPHVTDVLDDYFKEQDPKTRLCQWWVAKPLPNYTFSAEEIIYPAFLSQVFREFHTAGEDPSGKQMFNQPSHTATIDQFNEWWLANRSPRSMVQALWREE